MSQSEIPTTVQGYHDLIDWLDDLKVRSGASADSQWADAIRWYAQNDLYFMLRYVMTFGANRHHPTGRPVFEHQVHIDQCRALERFFKGGKGVLASARGIGKSETLCALICQTLVNYPDVAISIYSVEKSYAQKHLSRIRGELEKNELLKLLFEDVLWEEPLEMTKTQGVAWSKTDGLVIKGRKMNRSVPSVEVNSLYGHGEVGSRTDFIIFDDIETGDTVESDDKIAALKSSVSRAVSLLTPVALSKPVVIYANTRFAENGLINQKFIEYEKQDPGLVFDCPAEIIESRHESCEKYCWNEETGPLGGRITWPYNASDLQTQYDEKPLKREYVVQFALSFKSFDERALRDDNIQFYTKTPAEMAENCTTYICVDPSRGVMDAAAMWVWGLTPDKRKVWLDGVNKKMDPTKPEFWNRLFALAMQWSSLSQQMIQIRIEEAGPSTWAVSARGELKARGCYIPVVECRVSVADAERRFKTRKADRTYGRWSPMLSKGELLFPLPWSRGGRGIQCDMRGPDDMIDLVDYFLDNELRTFPFSQSDNLLDSGGQINDEKLNKEHPLIYGTNDTNDGDDGEYESAGTSWMSA